MFKKLTMAVLAAGLVFGPLPARAVNSLDSTFVQAVETDKSPEVASLDKEKPSKREKGEKEERVTGREKETEGKKKYDDFKDRDKNGIDDRFEKPGKPGKEPSKKKKKEEPGEVNF
ncbi:MAG: hypothetical protein L0209_03085 [candidate division Zixibacteria bacterium]|nr:hypothetical protein [candidate division Zixibacteria bacterium]